MGAPIYLPYHHPGPTHQGQETQKLLLIFNRDVHNTYSLVNGPGLPISNACPFLQTEARFLEAGLVAAVTAVVARNEGIYGGYSFLLSWVTNDNAHSFVILEKKSAVQGKDQGDEKKSSTTPAPAPAGAAIESSFEDPNAQSWGGDVGNNNMPSSPKSEWDDGWNTPPGGKKRATSPIRSASVHGEWFIYDEPAAYSPGTSHRDPWPTYDLAKRAEFSRRRPSTPGAYDGGLDMESVREWAWTPSDSD